MLLPLTDLPFPGYKKPHHGFGCGDRQQPVRVVGVGGEEGEVVQARCVPRVRSRYPAVPHGDGVCLAGGRAGLLEAVAVLVIVPCVHLRVLPGAMIGVRTGRGCRSVR